MVAASVLASAAAKLAMAELAHLGVHSVAAYHAAEPYLITYADTVAHAPWTVVAVIHGIPVYLHRTGSIPGPRPTPRVSE